jgi:nucleotide-binding universal stress UspA family protein
MTFDWEADVTDTAGAPIIAGVDGSESSSAAVRLAAQLAAERSRALRVVHAFIWPTLNVPVGPAPEAPDEGGLAAQAEKLVDDAVAVARGVAPDVDIRGEVITGAAATVLIAAARDAHLVVVGSRGLGGFTSLLIGSVAVQLVTYASCPVIVSRGEPGGSNEIVVGVEISEDGHRALDFAFAEAAYRGATLVAVRAFTHPINDGIDNILSLVYDPDEAAAEEESVLAEMLAGRADRYPDVVVHRQVVRERATAALIDAAKSASLLVVGARGRGGFSGLLLGSVSQTMLHHAPCPVAVIR